MVVEVIIRNGGLYLASADYDAHFAGHETVILMRRDRNLVVLPVHTAAAGGYLLKRRNAAGDRVIHGGDFLRLNGFPDGVEITRAGLWDESLAGLVLPEVFVN